MEINNDNLGGWAISSQLLNEAIRLAKYGKILEIGSGTGTKELRKIADVISI